MRSRVGEDRSPVEHRPGGVRTNKKPARAKRISTFRHGAIYRKVISVPERRGHA
jgi:hypothetical protein